MRFLTIPELQKSVLEFYVSRGWTRERVPLRSRILHLLEEAGELAGVVKYAEHNEFASADFEAELADVVLLAVACANEQGVDLGEIVWRKLRDNKRKYPAARGAE